MPKEVSKGRAAREERMDVDIDEEFERVCFEISTEEPKKGNKKKPVVSKRMPPQESEEAPFGLCT